MSLDAAAKDYMRGLMAEAIAQFKTVATVKKPAHGFAPGTKQPTQDWTTLGTAQCVISPRGGSLRETLLGRVPEATHRMFAVTALAIEKGCRVEASGKAYNVEDVQRPGPFPECVVAWLKEAKP